jgi:hypothetical protein
MNLIECYANHENAKTPSISPEMVVRFWALVFLIEGIVSFVDVDRGDQRLNNSEVA